MCERVRGLGNVYTWLTIFGAPTMVRCRLPTLFQPFSASVHTTSTVGPHPYVCKHSTLTGQAKWPLSLNKYLLHPCVLVAVRCFWQYFHTFFQITSRGMKNRTTVWYYPEDFLFGKIKVMLQFFWAMTQQWNPKPELQNVKSFTALKANIQLPLYLDYLIFSPEPTTTNLVKFWVFSLKLYLFVRENLGSRRNNKQHWSMTR